MCKITDQQSRLHIFLYAIRYFLVFPLLYLYTLPVFIWIKDFSRVQINIRVASSDQSSNIIIFQDNSGAGVKISWFEKWSQSSPSVAFLRRHVQRFRASENRVPGVTSCHHQDLPAMLYSLVSVKYILQLPPKCKHYDFSS